MTQMVAFLRGINLGRRRVKMADLVETFEALGLDDVRTLVASGNVLFAGRHNRGLRGRIETGLAQRFGFEVPTILRSVAQLAALCERDPFADWPESEALKRYAFFLSEPLEPPDDLEMEVDGDYAIVDRTGTEFFAIAHRQRNGRFGQGLDRFAKAFGERITNRNWNTVERIVTMAQER